METIKSVTKKNNKPNTKQIKYRRKLLVLQYLYEGELTALSLCF